MPKSEEYTLPHVAKQDTTWVDHPAAPKPETGKLRKGERVMFSRPADTGPQQDAKLTSGKVVFVDPGHFKPA